MPMGLIGRKRGMTRVFVESGESIPVTVIQVEPNRVTQVKTVDSDGYDAIQITTGTKRQSKVNKPAAGHFAKAGIEAGEGLWEFRVTPEMLQAKEGEEQGITVGSEINVELFTAGQKVDVTGTGKGKGFAGVIKRYNFSMQDATHGNSLSHRAPGSIGQNQTPGRVFKGKKMAGQMGNKRVTTQNLEVVSIDKERNLLLIKGPVPGAISGWVMINPAVKAKQAK